MVWLFPPILLENGIENCNFAYNKELFYLIKQDAT